MSEEKEAEKLLYFFPNDTPKDTKMKAIGLCEAIVKFSATFEKESACEVVHTQATRQVFYNPEPNFWMSMIVVLPFSQRQTKDGQTIIEYHEESVQNIVLHAFLRQAYAMYKLFNGKFQFMLDSFNREALVHKLDLFFPQYIHSSIDFEHGDLVDSFNGIQFLPLDKNTYLRVQCFVNLTESEFDAIKYTAFVYHDHLVWSGLEQDDMRVLYKFLTQGNEDKDFAASATSYFVTGPENLDDGETPINAPRLFLSNADDDEELHLVTYQCNDIKLCLLVSEESVMDIQFYKKLHTFIAKPLRDLDKTIGDQQAKRAAGQYEVQYKYLYFNHMNLAQKSSFMTLPKKAGQPTISTVSPEFVQYVTDMHTDFSDTLEDSEIVLKTDSDCWVVGRQSDQREFFVVLNQKNANLIEINEEIRRFSLTHFGNIFFVD